MLFSALQLRHDAGMTQEPGTDALDLSTATGEQRTLRLTSSTVRAAWAKELPRPPGGSRK